MHTAYCINMGIRFHVVIIPIVYISFQFRFNYGRKGPNHFELLSNLTDFNDVSSPEPRPDLACFYIISYNIMN